MAIIIFGDWLKLFNLVHIRLNCGLNKWYQNFYYPNTTYIFTGDSCITGFFFWKILHSWLYMGDITLLSIVRGVNQSLILQVQTVRFLYKCIMQFNWDWLPINVIPIALAKALRNSSSSNSKWKKGSRYTHFKNSLLSILNHLGSLSVKD